MAKPSSDLRRLLVGRVAHDFGAAVTLGFDSVRALAGVADHLVEILAA
jgi:hypothetical protein